MNDHPARPGDKVRVHAHTTRDGRDLGGMHLTVVYAHPGQPLACTEWTGAHPIHLPATDVDIVTRRGVA